jgi:hypothetical protein
MGLLGSMVKRVRTKAFWSRFLTLSFWRRFFEMYTVWWIRRTKLAGADVILAQACGQEPDGMGPANEYIAEVVKNLQDRLNIPAMMQGESEVCGKKLGVKLIGEGVIKLQSEVNPQDIYIDSLDAAQAMFRVCQQYNFTKPILVTFSRLHMVRAYWATIDAGFPRKEIRVPKLKSVYNRKSVQLQCRAAPLFFAREILGRPLLLFLGRL